MTGILLPNGKQANGGMYAVTLRIEGYRTNESGTHPDIFTKHIGIITELPKLGPEEINALTQSAAQIIDNDPDFINHKANTENYRGSISVVWLQKLDA